MFQSLLLNRTKTPSKLATVSPEIQTENIKPLIKWTGGKYREYKYFSHLIPEGFNRYIEPFAGGGGVFFALQPKGEALLNDKSVDLIEFYRALNDTQFKREMYQYVENWENILPLVKEIMFELSAIFVLYRNGSYEHNELQEIIYDLVDDCFTRAGWDFDEQFYIDTEAFKEEIKKNIYSKFTRIEKIEKEQQANFTEELLSSHIETAFKSGFYTHFRNILNQVKTGKLKGVNNTKRIANWYFVRELCYGAMFRYNSDGEFNIPYGGIAYNAKSLRAKANSMFSDETIELLRNTYFYNLDFEEFLREAQPQEEDFVFLDPPYDSDFSDYDGMAFTRDDQARLANTLNDLKGRWMLVIKKTEFIHDLYKDMEGVKMTPFNKTYSYNVRGRNMREAEHLIITNY